MKTSKGSLCLIRHRGSGLLDALGGASWIRDWGRNKGSALASKGQTRFQTEPNAIPPIGSQGKICIHLLSPFACRRV